LESVGNVKMEFEKFGGLLDKAQKNIQSGLNDLDTLVGTRSNAIRRQLKNVETTSSPEVKIGLPEILAVDADQ
jgi:DNA recombination protein RmuC